MIIKKKIFRKFNRRTNRRSAQLHRNGKYDREISFFVEKKKRIDTSMGTRSILMNRCCNNDVNRRISGVRNDKSGRTRRIHESMYHNNCPLNISRSFASIIKKKKKQHRCLFSVGPWFVSRHSRRMGFFLISIRRDSSVNMLLRDRFIAVAFRF